MNEKSWLKNVSFINERNETETRERAVNVIRIVYIKVLFIELKASSQISFLL